MADKYKQCYPFMDKFELCAKIDQKTEKQHLLICNKGEKNERNCGSIDCIHTAICAISPDEYAEVKKKTDKAISSEEINKIIKDYSTSSEGKNIDLSLEDKWMAFKSYVQGISESGWDAMDLVNNIPEINKSYPIGSSILKFVVENDPEYREKKKSDLFRKIEKDCKNEQSCLIANIAKYKRTFSSEMLEFALGYDIERNICNSETDEIEDILGCTKQIQQLNLYSNNLTSLPENIGNLKNLQELGLSYNQLESLPESIGKLENLQYLSLAFNKFESLPESIVILQNLQKLGLSNNKLTSLPESIGNMKNLQGLFLSVNKLTSLPESIGNLENLQSLYLSGNQMKSLPESIGNLQNLRELYLHNNKLTSLPENMKKSKNEYLRNYRL